MQFFFSTEKSDFPDAANSTDPTEPQSYNKSCMLWYLILCLGQQPRHILCDQLGLRRFWTTSIPRTQCSVKAFWHIYTWWCGDVCWINHLITMHFMLLSHSSKVILKPDSLHYWTCFLSFHRGLQNKYNTLIKWHLHEKCLWSICTSSKMYFEHLLPFTQVKRRVIPPPLGIFNTRYANNSPHTDTLSHIVMNKLRSNGTGVKICHVSNQQTPTNADVTKHVTQYWQLCLSLILCKTILFQHSETSLRHQTTCFSPQFYFQHLPEDLTTFW